MSFSPEIKLSRISAKIDLGDLTFNDLNEISEDLAMMIQSSSQKISNAAKKVFDQSQQFKSQMFKQDLSQIEKLAQINAKAQSLNASAVAGEADPEELEKEIADLAEDMHKLKKFFTPDLEGDALQVQEKIESLEMKHVFPSLRDLDDYARYLERRASEIEGV